MSEINTNGMGAADRLREYVASLESLIVDVTTPSGWVYRFRKPSKFGLLFEMGELPQQAASEAVEKWIADGVFTPGEDEKLDEAVGIVDRVLTLLDRVSHYSYEPKLILNGQPSNDNEILASEIPDGDLEYLCQFVKSGGEASAMLAMFPNGTQPGSLASASRRKLRTKAKSNGGS